MPYELLTIAANGANKLTNNIQEMMRLPCECYEYLRILTNGIANATHVLMNDADVLSTLPLPCHFLTDGANI